MYEQYTDKQIVEMLVPKLSKILGNGMWESALKHSEGGRNLIRIIAIIYRSAYIRGQLGRSFIIGEKKTKEPVNTFKVGDKVKFLGLDIEDEKALSNRRFYPPVNTIGNVTNPGFIYSFVQWPKGITPGDGIWACRNNCLKKVTEHWVPTRNVLLKKGDKVRMIDRGNRSPKWYPKNGTVGTVIDVNTSGTAIIQWPSGSTSMDDRWSNSLNCLEVLLCE